MSSITNTTNPSTNFIINNIDKITDILLNYSIITGVIFMTFTTNLLLIFSRFYLPITILIRSNSFNNTQIS